MGTFAFLRCVGARIALCGILAALILTIQGQAAFAQKARTFDPVLSLTGGCSKGSADEVPDPGPCPGTLGVDHPNASFSSPRAVGTDSYGNIYVASFGQKEEGAEKGTEGRIDIFDSSGFFITDLAVPAGPRSLAVDSAGNLYVIVSNPEGELRRYEPTVYKPATGEIKYGSPVTVKGEMLAFFTGLAVNPLNQHVFAHYGDWITEYGSAAEGNKVIEEKIDDKILFNAQGVGLAIDATHGRIYASDLAHSGKVPDPTVVRVFELNAPHAEIETIDGSTTPAGKFNGSRPSLAVDESTGNLLVYDAYGAEVVYELTEDGEYLGSIGGEKLSGHPVPGAEIAIDNGKNSPNGALSPFGRNLYLPAYQVGVGHSFAFAPPHSCEPEVKSLNFTGVSETEAQLHAQVNPCYLDTAYAFEYTTQESYEAEGFSAATVAGSGEIPAAGSPVQLSVALEGLVPGTAYRFRVVAENEEGSDEAETELATYPESQASPPCPNDALRTGLSALLPDCRAYELVTPSDTNAHPPSGIDHLGTYFATREASPEGDAVSFEIQGGSLPGYEATGSYGGDPYLASRNEDGWSTSYTGPSAAEAPEIVPGSTSPDQGYSFWGTAGIHGSATIEGQPTGYLHYPDGHSALIGRGSLGADPRAKGRLISQGGEHVIFETGVTSPAVQLEPNASPSGTNAVYDRTIVHKTGEEETHVVSLLPGNVTPAAGENALYRGASLDGKGIAFSIGNKLYLRFNNEKTYEIGENVTFAGVAEGGARTFYLEGGDLFALDISAGESIRFTEAGDVTPVNVAANGTAAYFVSPSVLTGEENPNGATAQPGKENLYLSEEGAISFVGTVTERDVEGEFGGNEQVDGLGLWGDAVQLGADPSRSTPDGSILLFESRAALAGYDPGGHAEVYRYDSVDGALDCLSCNPTLAPPTGQASLESVTQSSSDPEPFSTYAFVANLRADGRRAFFQSTEALVPADTDELQDVYEWEAQGVGTCERPGGCLYLISSGESNRADYLYAVSDSGDDAFFRSSDLLLASDPDETPSIYDARVGGGFSKEEQKEECQGESCRPSLELPPVFPGAQSGGQGASGNVNPKACPKGKHRVTHGGKNHCVKKRHKRRHRKAGTKKRRAGK